MIHQTNALIFNIILEILVSTVKGEKRDKTVYKKIKLSLFADGMTVYMEES